MSVDVVTEIDIACARRIVSDYAADPDHAPEWYVYIDSVRWLTEPGVRIGAQAAFVARFLGREMAYTYELVELDPGRRLVMRTAEGPLRRANRKDLMRLKELLEDRCRST